MFYYVSSNPNFTVPSFSVDHLRDRDGRRETRDARKTRNENRESRRQDSKFAQRYLDVLKLATDVPGYTIYFRMRLLV